MSDCLSSYRAATLLHGQLSFCRQYSFASVLPCSSIYAARQSKRDQRRLKSVTRNRGSASITWLSCREVDSRRATLLFRARGLVRISSNTFNRRGFTGILPRRAARRKDLFLASL